MLGLLFAVTRRHCVYAHVHARAAVYSATGNDTCRDMKQSF